MEAHGWSAVRLPSRLKRSAPQNVTQEPGWRMANPTYDKQGGLKW